MAVVVEAKNPYRRPSFRGAVEHNDQACIQDAEKLLLDHRDRRKRKLWGRIQNRHSVVHAHKAEAKARDLM